ncbi:MAG: 30S ribosome-binding factor RbfA [Isosphaera sp.]|nr:30S ribosome-binding factor RbfA [Isosphaera sp.]
MKHRRRQLESEIARAVQEALARGLSDPRLDGAMITVLGVDLSPEADRAVARVSVMPDKAQARALAALNHAAAHLRRKVGDALDLTTTPQLRFALDTSLKRQAAVIDALSRIADERRVPAGAQAPGTHFAEPSAHDADSTHNAEAASADAHTPATSPPPPVPPSSPSP